MGGNINTQNFDNRFPTSKNTLKEYESRLPTHSTPFKEINENLERFRNEIFKNNSIYKAKQGNNWKQENLAQNHFHLYKKDANEVDINNNNEVKTICKDISCNESKVDATTNDVDLSSNIVQGHSAVNKSQETTSHQESFELNYEKTYDIDEDLLYDQFDEDEYLTDNGESSDNEENYQAKDDTLEDSDIDINHDSYIKSFRDMFANDIVQGFTNFDASAKGPTQRLSSVQMSCIDKFHRNNRTDYDMYPENLKPGNEISKVDANFDANVGSATNQMPQVDGYNDVNMNDLDNGGNDINNNKMMYKEPYTTNQTNIENGKQMNDARSDDKAKQQQNYEQLWYNKFTLGRKEMSTVLRVKNVLCKQSDSTVFLVQATEWPGGRMVDNAPAAGQNKKGRNQPAYKVDIDQMEPEFGNDLRNELKNGSIASNLLALKVAKKKGTKKNSAQIYKEMAKELRFLRTFRNVDHHGFIIKIYAAFQTRQDLCVLTEFVPGGDLHTVASVSQIGIPETVAKFYMSEILCALGYIHKQQLVLRDLKLENVMVDLTGHVKLIDFGLAADLPGEVMLEPQRVGTRSYFPPEIDANQPYCESVDWWCFGVTMYDLLHQEVPIKEDENGNKVYDVNNIKYAERLSKPAVDLMTKLLVVDQFKRLENAEMVRFHPFFEPYSNDWRLVEDRKIRPPWIPGNKCLTSNLFPKCFDPFFTRQKLQVRPDPKYDEGEWGNGNYQYFQEFKYIGDIE